MDLETFLAQRKDAILAKWFDLTVAGYHPETARLLKRESSQFANPVGHALHEGMTGIFDEFLRGLDPEKLVPFLDRIIKIRAVQDFSPSQAVAFIFLLKGIVREELSSAAAKGKAPDVDLFAFDSKVDELALVAFNVYMLARERLYGIRITEVKNRASRLLQRAGLLAELNADDEPKPEEGNIP